MMAFALTRKRRAIFERNSNQKGGHGLFIVSISLQAKTSPDGVGDIRALDFNRNFIDDPNFTYCQEWLLLCQTWLGRWDYFGLGRHVFQTSHQNMLTKVQSRILTYYFPVSSFLMVLEFYSILS
jgi:hypothetical protein